ncbi:MAG: hypothetical protein KC476_02340 [Cyanobacteria bacterium HKST-UBA06]|nr:hypothetical protein [Cyanobacteria bacterium HKST-UBA06]
MTVSLMTVSPVSPFNRSVQSPQFAKLWARPKTQPSSSSAAAAPVPGRLIEVTGTGYADGDQTDFRVLTSQGSMSRQQFLLEYDVLDTSNPANRDLLGAIDHWREFRD